MVKKIPLTKGKYALVDDEDYEFLIQLKWQYSTRGYASRYIYLGYSDGHQFGKTLPMSRVITQAPEHLKVTYVDGDKLNNQKKNLRIGNMSQVQAAKKLQSNNTSGYRGVYWCGIHQKWISRVKVNGRNKYAGSFNTPEQAAKAYNQLAVVVFGEFARLNHIVKKGR